MCRDYQNQLFADRRTSFSQRGLGKSVYCYGTNLFERGPKYAGADNEDTIRIIPRDQGKHPINIGSGLYRLFNDFESQAWCMTSA